MPANRRLETDRDFNEAMEAQVNIRVFQDDHIIDSGGIITRFDSETIVVQSGVSELNYHRRDACEFFEMRKR
jgi:ribosome maturation factor RimP